jgi:sulfhydrogenase subunit gamma (sulfur reductase)
LVSQVQLTIAPASVAEVAQETPDTFTLVLNLADGRGSKDFMPGQFNMLYLLGIGEVPISIASSPNERRVMHTVRSVGTVTSLLAKLRPGDKLGLRGPFGKPWPMKEAYGMQLVVVAGGLGLPPLRPVILEAIRKPESFEGVNILYGARTPQDRVYKGELDRWKSRGDLLLLETVDVGDETWAGSVGVVTTLLARISVDPSRAIAFTCGPPIMIKFVIQDLLRMGFAEDRIVSTLERYRKCGVGKCGHCAIGSKYVCVDGPVFTYRQLKDLPEPP